ncbi:signal peptidase I [Hyalangium rubrum]|uniref:Signal peptidase I n=1 Tax=Hyalangium rubrum TaxID=3103134 RepID=A0ABU5H2B5_9BACT|nr:signal peptidase I [Hyalangium sp. s54d21]MDY7226240.1 signal peptidase I [Hyalangium sp. s54d21]
MKPAHLRLLIGLLVGFGVLAVSGVLALRFLVVHTWTVPSSSMYPAINAGDLISGYQWSYLSAASAAKATQRGDVVIFRHPEQGSDVLHRVVGLPGDTIDVLASGEVHVNGTPLPRCLLGPWPSDALQQVDSVLAFLETQGERRYVVLQSLLARAEPSHAVVPPGDVFVMGDNRDNSWDSRYWGTVPFANLRARVSHIVFAGEDPAVWEKKRLGHEVHASPLLPLSLEPALKNCPP